MTIRLSDDRFFCPYFQNSDSVELTGTFRGYQTHSIPEFNHSD